MLRTLLIANRGEIACRVIRTARRMGLRSVAVYSDADAAARHVALADEAHRIGPAPARDSYLDARAILGAASRSGADAIHPGYGFLSENADFAQACSDAGVTFIGPPPHSIRAMGSKAAAKALMERSGVPLVPGYHGDDQSDAVLAEAAAHIGYPVLLKASAGGGGKGMRVVDTPDAFAAALQGARREAAASFGDDRMLVERYLTAPRHIEIQIFADTHGNTISLFERDCSVQRRHQKVLEEAPAPGMTASRRRAMGEAACAAARAVGYVGAGTVEFIAEADEFYFMEMNTRLQVEHPVTEMITGLDLVEWQLRIADGQPLPTINPRIAGHALEARIYAEDPSRDFLPSIGAIRHLRQPAETADVRIDTGVREGDAISPYYDPMIAKLIVHAPDRPTALRRMATSLAEYEIAGVRTNLALLRTIVTHTDFAAGRFDTGFIANHATDLLPPTPPEPTREIWAAAALAVLAGYSADPADPWSVADAWRLNGSGHHDIDLQAAASALTIRAEPAGAGAFRLALPGGPAVASLDEQGAVLVLDGIRQRIRALREGAELTILDHGELHTMHVVDRLAQPATAAASDGQLTAPIPARVAQILVAPGDAVTRGARLIVLEAMKMELSLAAPGDGIIATIPHRVGDMVQEGVTLVTFVKPD